MNTNDIAKLWGIAVHDLTPVKSFGGTHDMSDKIREITPHKGGRTKTLGTRVTEDEQALISETAQLTGESIPDMIVRLVQEERKKLEKKD